MSLSTVAEVSFTRATYTAAKEDSSVQVCIALNDGMPFNTSSANGVFNISTCLVPGLSLYFLPDITHHSPVYIYLADSVKTVHAMHEYEYSHYHVGV